MSKLTVLHFKKQNLHIWYGYRKYQLAAQDDITIQ